MRITWKVSALLPVLILASSSLALKNADETELRRAVNTATAIPGALSTRTPACETAGSPLPRYEESTSIPPRADKLEGEIPGPGCMSRSEGYDYCLDLDRISIGGFRFRNNGSNPMVTNAGFPEPDHRFREFWFEMPGKARQELHFWISDSMSGTLSKIQESYWMVFPRKVTPSIRAEGEELSVTLPTGEEVRFDRSTKQISGGVMQEGPLKDGVPPAVSYQGAGVVLRADKRGDDPRVKNNTALITKPHCGSGEVCNPCRVPVSKLWTTDADDPRFRFPTDLEFERFIRANCGFGL